MVHSLLAVENNLGHYFRKISFRVITTNDHLLQLLVEAYPTVKSLHLGINISQAAAQDHFNNSVSKRQVRYVHHYSEFTEYYDHCFFGIQ